MGAIISYTPFESDYLHEQRALFGEAVKYKASQDMFCLFYDSSAVSNYLLQVYIIVEFINGGK